MLIVTNATQSEVLFESNYEKHEEQNGKVLEISFSSFSFPQNIGHGLLDYEVLIEDEDGHEYKVKQYKQVGTEKQVTATHIFFELGNQWKYDMFGGTHTFEEFATFLFKDTGWTYQNVDVTGSQVIVNFGNKNVLQMMNELQTAYNCEYQILPGKVIEFAKIIGEDNDLQYRYKYNINQLTQSIDTTSLKTQIRGYGGNGVAVTYTSPLADNPLIGIRVAEPFEDTSITTQEAMIAALKEQLSDVPETVIEISVTEVDGNVGDYIWIIHEEMNLSYQTRILSKKTKRHYADGTITVGNTVRKDITDILVTQKATIDENNKVMRSRFEQTNERIDMEVETINESIAQITIKGSEEIEARVMDKVNEEFAAINLRADEIEMSVQDANDNIAKVEATATKVETTVSSQQTTISDLGTRVSSAESSLSQANSQIALKVSQTDYNGNVIASLINQTADTVTIDASKINLRGAVTVLSDLSNDLGNITAGNIDLQTDVKVGNKIWLTGGSGESGLYFDRFGSSGKIYSNGNNMVIFSDAMQMNSMYGIDVYNGMRINGGLWVDGVQVTGSGGGGGYGQEHPTTRTSGLSFGFSTAANRLYVGLNGYDYGYIQLTPLY